MTATYPDLPARDAARTYDHHSDDPLGDDQPTDPFYLTTRRGLYRVVTVAAEAGARFQREGCAIDPMSWMLTPRVMFDGANAIDACVSMPHFINALMLHGLGLGTDADPELFVHLVHDDPVAKPPAPRHVRASARYAARRMRGGTGDRLRRPAARPRQSPHAKSDTTFGAF
ncbi:hypothetical protein [Novosphingobium terrae]|uniref:hypothetical protein n=1 Tax=Novosphingobium terrae TaxID=2726189 RepID=UPI00198140D5|nr:hypothetical protein [Novosphingobium terrae]